MILVDNHVLKKTTQWNITNVFWTRLKYALGRGQQDKNRRINACLASWQFGASLCGFALEISLDRFLCKSLRTLAWAYFSQLTRVTSTESESILMYITPLHSSLRPAMRSLQYYTRYSHYHPTSFSCWDARLIDHKILFLPANSSLHDCPMSRGCLSGT